jgi:hypothetical protein
MERRVKTISYVLPIHWAGALINGDELPQDAVPFFKERPGIVIDALAVSEEWYTAYACDIDGYAGNVARYTFPLRG